MEDEARLLRERQAELARLTDEGDIPPQGSCAMVVKTKTVGTYPTVAKSFYAVDVVNPGGTESEGSAGSFAVVTGTFFALNAGSTIPPSGTQVIVDPIGGRWVFVYNG